MRTLTITTAEWASVKDGTLWLVREGTHFHIDSQRECFPGPTCPGWPISESHPPAEFVQACAFCTACDARLWDRGHNRKTDCLDCRIALVGPCLACVSGEHSHEFGHPVTTTLGHAYAVGQPLPIVKGAADVWLRSAAGSMRVQGGCVAYTQPNKSYSPGWVAWSDGEEYGTKIGHTALAHYGPPESLVGTWALQLAVTA